MGFNVKDANLSLTTALPNGAAAVTSAGWDLGAQSGKQDFLADCELHIESPALLTGDLADAATLKFDVEHAAASDYSDATALAKEVLVQTGAGGAGAAAANARFRLPTTCKRYLRVKATKTGAGDASDKSMTTSLKF